MTHNVTLIVVFRERDNNNHKTEKARVSTPYSLLIEPQQDMKLTLHDNTTFYIDEIHQNLKSKRVEVIQYKDIIYYKSHEIEKHVKEYEKKGWTTLFILAGVNHESISATM
jgi:hypothetical protein